MPDETEFEDQIAEAVSTNHYNGDVRFEYYTGLEEPDVVVCVTGEFACIHEVLKLIRESEHSVVTHVAHSGGDEPDTRIGIDVVGDPSGALFETEL